MPYVDINPNHKRGPRWLVYVFLAVLAVVTFVVVGMTLGKY